MIASLAFADEEEEEAGSAPEKPASGGKLISALAFDLDEEGDEDEEEGTVMAPAGTSYTPPAAAAPAPVAPVAPPAPAAPVAPPAPAAPVTPPVAPAAPAAPVMPETDQGDGDEKPDVTFPTTFRQGATPSALSGAASPGMDAGMGDEADQDDWDASGALDNTVDFQAYLLSEADQAPAKEEPPIQGAAFTREKPPEPTATAATADTMVAGTPEAAQNIFDAVSETPPSPWKKWAIIGGSLAAVALFSVMGYQYAELSGLLKTPAMRGFTARVAEWVPFVDPPKPVRPPRRPVAVRPSIPLQPAVKPPAAVRAPLAPAVMEKSPVRESAALVPRSSPPSRAETPAAPVAPAAAPAVPKAPPVSEVLRQPSTVAEKPVPPADRRPAAPRIDTHQRLMMARNAFYSGRGDRARALYDEVLRLDDTNRDALMGLAALGVSDGRYGKAAGYYMRLLELDPRDSVALAGLTSLSGNIDAQNQESRIKAILQGEPNAPHLYFALGGLYAAQSRWSEAQHVFFKALSGDDTNADFAFNLAVSLDHLGQERAALPYYRRALALATLRPGRFDAGSVKARVADLSRELDNRAAGVAAGPLE